MAIGSLGDIVFEVTDDHALTFQSMNYSVGARYSTHNRMNKRPLAEYNGPDAESLSLTITLSTFLGIYPRKNMYKINKACREGTPMRLVIGKTQFGRYKWVITKTSCDLQHVDNKGRILKIVMKLTLKEYARR